MHVAALRSLWLPSRFACARGSLRIGTVGSDLYGRFARDFDYDLFRLTGAKAAPESAETHASVPRHAHCDVGSHAPVVLDAVTGERAALFPGGITQRAAPVFAAVVSRLAGSASPSQVASSVLRAQALQTGAACSVMCASVLLSVCVLPLSVRAL